MPNLLARSGEALDLTLGPRSIGLAEPRHEAVMVREVEEGPIVAVQARPVGIARGHHRMHIVVQHLARDAAEVLERSFVTGQQRLEPLVDDEFDVGRTAPTQGRDEYRKSISSSAPNGGKSTRICRPGWVSNRIRGSGFASGRSAPRCSLRTVMPP
jgi:hypothetical protein